MDYGGNDAALAGSG